MIVVAWPDRRGVFVDTSAFFALADANDANHAAAQAIRLRLMDARYQPFTTNFVVAETHGLVLARRNRYEAIQALREIEDGETIIVRVAARDEHRARQILAAYDDHDFSLTDATSFAVMERLHIAHAFTFDRHFSEVGFHVLEAGSELREESLAYVS